MDLNTAFSQFGDLYIKFTNYLFGTFATSIFGAAGIIKYWPFFFAFVIFVIFILLKGIISIFNDL